MRYPVAPVGRATGEADLLHPGVVDEITGCQDVPFVFHLGEADVVVTSVRHASPDHFTCTARSVIGNPAQSALQV
jgi:hypothetical protein